MPEHPDERLKEERRAHHVQDAIRVQIAALSERLGQLKEQVVDIRKHFWDDVTVNLDDPDDVIETSASLKQQAELLSERERIHVHAERQAAKLRRLLQSPYFGRIDFREDGDAQTQSIYLGIGSLPDEDGLHFLIYDWRAPVSSLYYDHGPGPADYETPMGIVRGTLDLKRQFIFQSGEMKYMFDTGLTIGDEMLQQVLGRGADSQMKTIVATIQREQNRIIRNDSSRMLIVDGPAGSGKTSAALQRVAYLLYKHRRSLTADQIVLFSPNPMFNRYVEGVLPELGEENMEQTTFQEYLEHRLTQRFSLEDPFTRMEYVLTASSEPEYEDRLAGISFKSSQTFLDIMKGYLSSLEHEGLAMRDIKLRGEVLVSKEQLESKLYGIRSTTKLAPRIGIVVEWALQELEAALLARRGESWVDEEIELLESEELHRIARQVRREQRQGGSFFNEGKREHEIAREWIIRRHLNRLQTRVKRLKFIDQPATYGRLFANPKAITRWLDTAAVPALWPDICAQTLARLGRGELAYEDATPFLYMQESIEGFRINMNIRHVLVDEAQDYSPFQYEFLRKLFPRSRMTALGDMNQAIFTHSSLQAFEVLNGLYGSEHTEMIRLQRTYRSTRPIVEFTRGMLPGGGDIEPFNREGERPTVSAASNTADLHERIARRLSALLERRYKTIAVICKTARESRSAFEALPSLVQAPIRLVTQETAAFETGIVVIPSYLAKGIEFDAVIIYDASDTVYGDESLRKLLYTACTRAMHELHLFHIGAPSPFVSAIDADAYAYVRLS